MAYTLDQLITDCKASLSTGDDRAAREAVLEHVKKALADEPFIAAIFGPQRTLEREVLYEDEAVGFCICAHVYSGAKTGQPHDHGPTWAIYGQVDGETEMTDWELVTPPDGDRPGTVKQVRSYRLRPGDAHLYEPGAVHAPLRTDSTRLLRIEGYNTDRIERTPLRAAS